MNFELKLAQCLQDEKLDKTPQLCRNPDLLIEENSLLQLTSESPTPLLGNKKKLGQYESIIEENIQIAEDGDQSESESEHSLLEDADERDYYYQIRMLQEKLPGKVLPDRKYDLRKLLESELYDEIPTPEIEDLPENYSQ